MGFWERIKEDLAAERTSRERQEGERAGVRSDVVNRSSDAAAALATSRRAQRRAEKQERDTARSQARQALVRANQDAAEQRLRIDGVLMAVPPVPRTNIGLRIFPDRLEDKYGRVYPLSPETQAEVHTSGGVAGVNKHDWFLMAGARAGKLVDKRNLIVSIEDPAWTLTLQYRADVEGQAREWAARIKLYVRQLNPGTPSTPTEPVGDLLDKLTKLGELRASGVLTEDEFQAQKASLLQSETRR